MLKVENLCYCIGDKILLDKISLTFSIGKFYGILGPNGAGKSTFLKTLTCLLKLSYGEILWHGEDICMKDRLAISKTLSLVPQALEMRFFDFSVYEIVSMGLYMHHSLSSSFQDYLIEWALKLVDAWQFRDRSIVGLSNGERQRVFIARSLVTRSPVLLLDEPTSSLDIRHQLDIYNILIGLKNENKIVIAVLHDLNMAKRFCDEIVVLHKGRCIGIGPFDSVLNDSCLDKVFDVRKDVTYSKSTLEFKIST